MKNDGFPNGSRVLITGASSGIGKSIATLFANEGFSVIGVSRHITPQESQIGKGSLKTLQADINDETSLKRLVKNIPELDILIHCAGFGLMGSAEQSPVEEAQKQFETNFFGALRLNTIFMPILRKNPRSLILFISSMAAEFPLPFQGHYSASKAALESYAEALQMEAASFGVRVSILQPDDCPTNFSRSRKNVEPPQSIYQPALATTKKIIIQNENTGTSSEVIAQKALQIVLHPHPRFKYPIKLKYRLLLLLAHLCPDAWRLAVVSKLYGIQKRVSE